MILAGLNTQRLILFVGFRSPNPLDEETYSRGYDESAAPNDQPLWKLHHLKLRPDHIEHSTCSSPSARPQPADGTVPITASLRGRRRRWAVQPGMAAVEFPARLLFQCSHRPRSWWL